MSIYTRTGDLGETDSLGGPRVAKDSSRPEVCGAMDELDAWLGLARCETLPGGVGDLLEQIQGRMVALRAELADATAARSYAGAIGPGDVKLIEQAIDQYNSMLPPLHAFLVPGGARGAALLHVARTVCRRAERRLVTLARAEPQAVSAAMLAYINRLGDLLFVLARAANANCLR
jgi:cob(I)alamin adenosyltransferase